MGKKKSQVTDIHTGTTILKGSSISDIAGKFDKMEKYYTNIIPVKGENIYKVVDLRFDGQIVCRK